MRRNKISSSDRRQLRELLRDRRGVSTLVFAGTAAVLMGFAGLAIDGGLWYTERRSAQTAADVAAQSAARVLIGGSSSAAVAAGIQVASLNGYTSGPGTVVQVNHPPLPPSPSAGNMNRVQVIIERDQRRYLSAFFLGADPRVRVQAVAGWQAIGPICLQAAGQVTNSGSTNFTASGCVIYANGEGMTSGNPYNLTGNSQTVTAEAAFTTGAECPSRAANSPTPCFSQAPPAPWPPDLRDYMSTSQAAMPSFSGASCINVGANTTSDSVSALLDSSGRVRPSFGTNGTGRAICGTQNNAAILFRGQMLPGVYYIQNADLSFRSPTNSQETAFGITQTTCNGCTFILLSNPSAGGNVAATLDMQGSAAVNLSAPTSDPLLSATPVSSDTRDYSGTLVYRHCTAAADGCATTGGQSTVNGTTNSTINGAIYMPHHNIRVLGTGTITANTCNPIFARNVTLSGNSQVAVNGCASSGANLDQAQIARLYE